MPTVGIAQHGGVAGRDEVGNGEVVLDGDGRRIRPQTRERGEDLTERIDVAAPPIRLGREA
jgi:hypothetical protein